MNDKNYDLSASAYKPAGTGSETDHRNPKEILNEIDNIDDQIVKQKILIKNLIK